MFAIIHRKLFLYIALAVVTASVAVVLTFGLRLGIDFTGGSLTEVSYATPPTAPELEAAIAAVGQSGFSIRTTSNESGRAAYVIQTKDLTDTERAVLTDAVAALGSGATVDRFTSIGPVIGQELQDKAVWAIASVSAVIILYVAFAFAGIGTPVSSWVYGGITIVVLLHDVLVPAAVMSLLGYFFGIETDVLFVMAILAVLGYSVNDTIVVFDRVREKLMAHRTEHVSKREEAGIVHEDKTYTLTRPYEELVGEAVSETMARSINTSITTSAALVALYFFGGSVTQTFALLLLAGVVAGTYSSIFIANPLIVAYEKWKNHA